MIGFVAVFSYCEIYDRAFVPLPCPENTTSVAKIGEQLLFLTDGNVLFWAHQTTSPAPQELLRGVSHVGVYKDAFFALTTLGSVKQVNFNQTIPCLVTYPSACFEINGSATPCQQFRLMAASANLLMFVSNYAVYAYGDCSRSRCGHAALGELHQLTKLSLPVYGGEITSMDIMDTIVAFYTSQQVTYLTGPNKGNMCIDPDSLAVRKLAYTQKFVSTPAMNYRLYFGSLSLCWEGRQAFYGSDVQDIAHDAEGYVDFIKGSHVLSAKPTKRKIAPQAVLVNNGPALFILCSNCASPVEEEEEAEPELPKESVKAWQISVVVSSAMLAGTVALMAVLCCKKLEKSEEGMQRLYV